MLRTCRRATRPVVVLFLVVLFSPRVIWAGCLLPGQSAEARMPCCPENAEEHSGIDSRCCEVDQPAAPVQNGPSTVPSLRITGAHLVSALPGLLISDAGSFAAMAASHGRLAGIGRLYSRLSVLRR